VVDISCFEGRDPIDDIIMINTELLRYSPELAERPQIIVANKCDALDPELVDVKAFEEYVRDIGCELIYVSAATGENLDELVRMCAEKLRELPPMLVYEREFVEEAEPVAVGKETLIRRENNTFYVEGEWLYNLMGQINFDDYESMNYFQKVLKNSGVFEMLEAKGCSEGDTVSIYDFEFDYVK
jgi:GTP-binding protein